MLLIPYTVHKNPKSEQYLLNLFLENGGSSIIQVESFENAEDFLGVNDMYLKYEIWQEGDTLYAPINSTKTDMNAFYKWQEVSYRDTYECWRPFLILKEYIEPLSGPFGIQIKTILSHITKKE